MSKIYRNGLDAFNGLDKCGLELQGRDQETSELLRMALDPAAASLQIALRNCSPEEFVKAFLKISAPYVLMLRDLLKMFEAANASRAEKQWRIQFEDYLEEVEHFKEWERVVRNIGQNFYSPNPSFREFWNCMAVFRASVLGAGFWNSPALKRTTISLPPPTASHPVWLHELWVIIMRAQMVLDGAGLDLQSARTHPGRQSEEDFFSVNNLCQQQTDFGITQAASAYQVLHGNLVLCNSITSEVEASMADATREWVWIEASVDELRSFLSLPVWQRRHDFYAAWIAAIMLDEFREDGIWICEEEGVISFPFRESHVGLMLDRTADLVAERRSKLLAPTGKGRRGGVQPDYGWWRPVPQGGSRKVEDCALVVEVKHYKRSARGSWRDVLVDYANAHPRAQTLLVNYGPGSDVVDDVPAAFADRCLVIGDLRPGQRVDGELVVNRFRRLVRRHVVQSRTALAIDVSPSMAIRERRIADLLVDLASEFECDTLLAFDREIAGAAPVAGLTDEIVSGFARDVGENFDRTLREALMQYPRVVLVTDWGGYNFAMQSNDFSIKIRHMRDGLHLVVAEPKAVSAQLI